MLFCGFNLKMLHGLTEFAQGIHEQALKRAKDDSVSIERAFEIEVEEMNIFFQQLDEKYYKELRPKHSVAESIKKLIDLGAFYPENEK